MVRAAFVAAVFGLVCKQGRAELLMNFVDNPPRVPTGDVDLVVEQVWQFPTDDPALMIRWLPNSDQVITVHKLGTLRLYDSIDSDVDTFTPLYDMTADVWSDADHGLMSIEFSPDWPDVPALFLLYTGEPKDVNILPNYAGIEALRPPDFEGAYSWGDTCPSLSLLNPLWDNSQGSICEHPYYIDRVLVDMSALTATKDITLMQTACGSGSSHAAGTIMLVGKDLVFSQGDGSQYAYPDYGQVDDGCYDPNAPDVAFQGQFRAQRDDSPNGKIHRIPYKLLSSPTEIDVLQLEVIAKGMRNPFRIFYHELDDSIYVGDVGYGDAGTSERIFRKELVSDVGAELSNFGWPCLEGVRNIALGAYTIFDSPAEQDRIAYVTENGLTGCNGVYAAADAYVQALDPTFTPSVAVGDEADPTWVAPLYEYRVDALDSNYPDECVSGYGAITNVHIYDGTLAPASITGKLIFSDYAKKCAWYFENGDDGLPDTTKQPTVLFANAAMVDMRTGADGYLYAVEYAYRRVFRMYQSGLGPYQGNTVAPTKAATLAPTLPFIAPTVEDANVCFPTTAIPELEWTPVGDGAYFSQLTLGAANVTLPDGTTMRTRVWNGLMPGPIMRLKPCNKYYLRVINDLEDWPNPTGQMNTMNSPSSTNIHLHGMHISGEAPGDDSFTTILPGVFFEYTFNIPCDHLGGTHLYHTHNHGSVALQTDSGAMGMIIVESAAREAYDMPLAYQALPEHMIVVQEFSPTSSTQWAAAAGDKLFVTDAVNDFTVVNGCQGGVALEVEEGQWQRLRILRLGLMYNSMVELVTAVANDTPCDLALLSKDGIPLADLPRALPDALMFMSVSSRIDVAIRCPLAGSSHILQQRQIGNTAVNNEYREIVANITVVPSVRPAADDLPAYTPCRPSYLQDLEPLAVDLATDLEIRDSFNGYIFEGEDAAPFATLAINETVTWLVTGDEIHPMHVHINHLQLGDMDNATNQWDDVPNWNVAGDWIDTLSIPGISTVRLRPTEFTGKMVMHCHIAEHSDTGVMAINEITGVGYDGVTFPVLTDYGSCLAVVPASTSYNALPAAIPGVILASEYDLGGEMIAYHNQNIATNLANAIRLDEAVEIRVNAVNTFVSNVYMGEWLRFSVTVTMPGMYSVTMKAYQDANVDVARWSLWLNENQCPPPTNTDNLLAQSSLAAPANATAIVGEDFENFAVGFAAFPTAGDATLLLCFDATPAGGFSVESLTFAVAA